MNIYLFLYVLSRIYYSSPHTLDSIGLCLDVTIYLLDREMKYPTKCRLMAPV